MTRDEFERLVKHLIHECNVYWNTMQGGDVSAAESALLAAYAEVEAELDAKHARLVKCGDDLRAAESRSERLAEALRGLADAGDVVVYCVECWDNPEHNLCPKHLDPLKAALATARAALAASPAPETAAPACALPIKSDAIAGDYFSDCVRPLGHEGACAPASPATPEDPT